MDKKKLIQIKLKDDEYSMLKNQAEYYGLNISAYSEKIKEWDEENQKWNEGLKSNHVNKTWISKEEDEKNLSYEDYAGKRPDKNNYMPEWTDSEKTMFVMYEDTSEGTPISPPFETAEELAHWLADNNASAVGNMTATYEEWLRTIQRGYAIGMVLTKEGFKSGVELL